MCNVSVQGLCHLMISGSVPTVCYVQQQLCTEILYDENGQKMTPRQGRKKQKCCMGQFAEMTSYHYQCFW